MHRKGDNIVMSNTTAEKPKRKTTTSWQVKQRYNGKNYTRVHADLPKELVATFKEAVQEQEVSVASVLKKSLEQFVAEYPPASKRGDIQNVQT